MQPGPNGKKPKNTTLEGFHKGFAVRFRERLGPKPTLWQWQSLTESFLKKWCPEGRKSDFRWKDPSRPDFKKHKNKSSDGALDGFLRSD